MLGWFFQEQGWTHSVFVSFALSETLRPAPFELIREAPLAEILKATLQTSL